MGTKGTSINRKAPLGWPSEHEQAGRVVVRGKERLEVIEALLVDEPSPGARERLALEAQGIKNTISKMAPAKQKHLWARQP